MGIFDFFKKKKVVEEDIESKPETPKTPKQENKESFIETEVNNEADVAPKEKQENIIEIDFGGGWYFKLSKDRFFGLLDHYDWEYAFKINSKPFKDESTSLKCAEPYFRHLLCNSDYKRFKTNQYV